MSLFGRRSSFEKREIGSLSKTIKLRPSALSHRLALEAADYDTVSLDASLNVYYAAAVDLTQRRDKLLFWYTILICALYAQFLGFLEVFQFSGVALHSDVTAHFLLLMTSAITLLFTFTMAKVNRYVQIFDYAFQSATGAKKQDLILRYPRIFSPLHFDFWMTGSPKYMVHKKTFSVRVALVLLLSVPAIIATMLFFYWLIGSVSVELWTTESESLGLWSKIIVAMSVAMILASTIMPPLSFKKIAFEHFGLLDGLERLQSKDTARHSLFVLRTCDAQKRMGLSVASNTEERD